MRVAASVELPIESVERISEGLWRVRLKRGDGTQICFALNLDDFEPSFNASQEEFSMRGVGFLGRC
jgi:hypothetical protein